MGVKVYVSPLMAATNTTSAVTTEGEMILLVDSARNTGSIVPDFLTRQIGALATIVSIINVSGGFIVLEYFSQNITLRLLLSDYCSQNIALILMLSEYNYRDIALGIFLSVYHSQISSLRTSISPLCSQEYNTCNITLGRILFSEQYSSNITLRLWILECCSQNFALIILLPEY